MGLRRRKGQEPICEPRLRVGMVDNRGTGPVPPSAAIRVYRRVRHVTTPGLSFERLDPAEYAAGRGDPVDVLLVIRDAFAADDAERAIVRAQGEDARVVVDLDDDLFTDHAVQRLASQGHDEARLAALRSLLGLAHVVTVSTPFLRHLVESRTAGRVSVIPNELDPLLWASDQPEADSGDLDPEEVRLLYMGSKTHAGDLALIDELPAALQDHLGRPVTLELVGVTPGGDLPPGTRRLVPDKSNYAGFVRWLRGHRRRWHAAVAPLADTPFNAAKSDLKLLEYAALGLRAVASPHGPYAGLPDVLARPAATPRQWVDAVADQLALGSAVDARAWVLQNRTLTPTTVADWEQTLLGYSLSRPSR